MSWTQQDTSFKKLQSKRITTSTGKGINEEKGASALELYLPDIKTEIIPGTPPGVSTSILAYTGGIGQTLAVDTSVAGNLTWFATSGYGNTTVANDGTQSSEEARLMSWVSDKYDAFGTISGAGYEVKLYDANSNLITKTDPSDWLFDYQTGILTFNNANTAYGAVATSGPYRIVGYRYIGKKGIITAAYGGLGFTTYNFGDILVGAGTSFIKLPLGTNNFILSASTSSAIGLSWIPNTGGVGAGSQFSIPYYTSAGSAITGSIYFTNTGSGISIAYPAASTSTSTGALSVVGGVGIGGTLNVNNIGIGYTGIPYNPSIAFIGTTGDPIRLNVLSNNTLSFEGRSGQLFSINNNLSSGWIFSVNDISGIPLFRANADATISMAEYAGNVGIGLSNPTFKFQVAGSASIGGTVVTNNLQINSNLNYYPATGTTGGISWATISLPAGVSGINKMIYANNKFVGVGNTFAVYSTDGITWSSVNFTGFSSSENFTNLAYGNGIYLTLAGSAATVGLYSTDAITWTRTFLPTSRIVFRGMAYGNGCFVAYDQGGNIIRSTDGISWSTVASIGGYGREIKFLNGLFFGTFWSGSSGPDNTWYSTDGITWTFLNIPVANQFGLTYGNGRYVASTGTTSIYSTDLVTWTNAVRPDSYTTLFTPSYHNGTFYISNNFGGVYYSKDLISWGIVNGLSTNEMVYGADKLILPNGTSVLVSQSAQGKADISPFLNSSIENTRIGAKAPDSATFTHLSALNNVNFTSPLNSSSVNNGALTVKGGVGIGGTTNLNTLRVNQDLVFTPTTGTTATAGGLLTANFPSFASAGSSMTRTVTFGNGRFVGSAGTSIIWSEDAVNWNRVNTPFTSVTIIWQIAYGNGTWVATKYDAGTEIIYSTNNGNSWSLATVPYTSAPALVFGNGIFVTGSGQYTGISTNGINWSTYSPVAQADRFINGFFYSNTHRSPDGINWQALNIPVTNVAISYGNGLYFAAQYNSTNYYTSYDGVNFSTSTITYNVHLNSAYYNGVYYLTTQHNIPVLKYSTDGFNYTNVNYPNGSTNYGIAYGNNKIVLFNNLYTEATNYIYYAEASFGKANIQPFREGTIDNVTIGSRIPQAGTFNNVSVLKNLNVNSNFQSVSSNTGALTVLGGVGIGASINIGGRVGIGTNLLTSTFNLLTPTSSTIGAFIQGRSSQTADFIDTANSSGIINFSVGANGNVLINLTSASSKGLIIKANASQSVNLLELQNSSASPLTTFDQLGNLNISSTTASGSTSTGALVVSGGVGIGGTLNANTVNVVRDFNHTPNITTIGGASGWVASTASTFITPSTFRYLNNKYIGIGGSYIYYSDDMLNWSSVNVPNLDSSGIADIAYGEGKYVIVQYFSSNAGYSTNLTNWTIASSLQYNNWFSLAYGNGTFVATSGGSPYAVSSNGINWSNNVSATHGFNTDIKFLNGYFYSSSTQSLERSTDGITWQTCNTPAIPYGITYGNGLYVGGVYNSATIVYSYDGLNFSSYTGSSFVHKRPYFFNGVYYITLQNEQRIRYSTDGFNWLNSTGFPGNVDSMVYAQGKLYAGSGNTVWVTDATPGRFEVNPLRTGTLDDVEIGRLSPNNANFIDVSVNNNLNVSSQYDSASYLDGALTVAGGVGIGKTLNVGGSVNVSNSLNLVNSTTGIATTWTRTVVGTAATIGYLAYANNLYVGVGYSSLTSTDGVNWTTRTLPNDLSFVSYGNGIWSGLLFNSALGATSTNGTSWTSYAMTNSRAWTMMAFGNGKFVTLARLTNIAAYSTNGYNWTEVTMPTSQNWVWVTYGGGYFLAVANSSATAIYSNDGINWNTTTLPSAAGWNSVTYGNGYYFAVGSGNAGAYSKDLINWTSYPLNVSGGNGLFVSYNNGTFEVHDSPTTNSNIITGDFSTRTSVAIPFSQPLGQSAAGDRNFIAGFGLTFYSFPIPNNSITLSPNTTGEINNVEIGSVKPAAGNFSNIFSQGLVAIGATTRSTTPFNGSLTVSGGVGIGGTLNANSVVTYNRLQNQSFSGASVGASDGRMTNFDAVYQYQSTGNGVIVATSWGAYNARYSNDGSSWQVSTLPVNQPYPINFFGNGYFVLSASGSTTVLYSTNGSSWSQVSIGNTEPRSSGTYGNGKYVIVGSGTTYNYSSNLTSWSTGTLPLTGDWRIAYGNGIFVALAYGTNRLIYSYDAINWNIGNIDSINRNFMKITYTNGKFMVTAWSSGGTWYSEDGINWFVTNNPGGDVVNLSYGNGVYFTNDSLRYTYSSDGFNWSSLINFSAGYEAFQSVYAFNKFNTVGRILDGPTNTVTLDPKFTGEINNVRIGAVTPASGDFTNLSSTGSANLVGTVNANNLNILSKINQTPVLGGFAGTTGWTSSNIMGGSSRGIAFGNGLFVSTRINSNIANFSSDGKRWTSTTLPFTGDWKSVAWGVDKFVAVAGVGTTAAYSGNGVSWTSMNMPPTAQGWLAVTYGDDKFVAVGNTSTAAYSSDGITWSASSIANTSWTGVAYGNGTFVAVAGAGQSGAYSYDGINWNYTNLTISSANLKTITYGNGYFVVTSYVNASISYSRDGINWSSVSRSSNANIHTGIAYGNGIYNILNYAESSFSYDALNWTNSNNVQFNDWLSLSYGNNRFVGASSYDGHVSSIDGPSNTLNLHPKFTGDIDNVRIGAKQPGAAEFTNLAAQQPVRFTANTNSTDSTSGALVVLGGVGIGGSVNSTGLFNFGTLQAPAISSLSGFGTGGLSPSTTYYYKLSAIDYNNNESLPSPEYSVTTSASQYGTRFFITTSPGASGYKLYRTTTSGNYINSFVQTYRIYQQINNFRYDVGKATSAGSPVSRATGNTVTLGSSSSVPFNVLPSLTIPSGSLQVKSPNVTSFATPGGVQAAIETGTLDYLAIRDPFGYSGLSVSTGGTLTPGQTYYYVATIVDHYGNESLPTEELGITVDAGGAVLIGFNVLSVQVPAFRIYRTTTPGNYTNSYLGELPGNKDIGYPTMSGSPPTTTSFAGIRLNPRADFDVMSYIPNIDLAPSHRNGFLRKLDVPYTGAIAVTTSGTAGSLLPNTTYYYKCSAFDIFGGSAYPTAEVSVSTGTSTAVTISGGGGILYAKVYRSTTKNNYSNVPTYYVNSFPFTDRGDTTFTDTPSNVSTYIQSQLFRNQNNSVPQNYLRDLSIGPILNNFPFSILAPVTGLGSVTASTGGTLVEGQVYYYVMEAVDVYNYGSSSGQPIRFVATAGGAANVSQSIVGGYGYVAWNLYRTSNLASWTNSLIAAGIKGTSFIDIGYPGRSGSPNFGYHRARNVVFDNRGVFHIPTIANQFYGQNITAPSAPYRTGGNSAGSLTTNTTYYYRVMPYGGANQSYGYASDEFQYTTGANEKNISMTIGGHKIGAMYYRVYRSTTFNNFTNAYYFETPHTSFIDYGHTALQTTGDVFINNVPYANTVNLLNQGSGNYLAYTTITGQTGGLKIHLKSPVISSISSGTGGTLSTNTDYWYKVDAIDAYGLRTFVSDEAYINTGANNSVTLTWDDVPGAYYYRVFRATASQTFSNKLIASYVSARTFTDLNFPATTGTPVTIFENGQNGNTAALFQMDNTKYFGIMPRTIITNIDSSQANWYTDFSLRITSPPVPSASAALLQVGSGFTNFSSAGFNGSIYGTQIAIGAAVGFTGSLLDAQTAGISRFRINFDGSATIGSTTGSTSTTSGAFIVSGGVGIGGSLNIGSDVIINGGRESNSTSTGSLIVRGGVGITGGLYVKPFSLSTKGLVVQANTSQSGNLFELQSAASSTITSFNSAGELNITSTTGSTSASFGSIVTAGGVGIGGSVSIGSTAGSSSTTSGALKVTGGVGIGGALNVGGSINFSSSIFGGVSTSIVPTMTFIGPANDPITLSVLSDNSLSFDGSSGQLFSINNNLSTGWIFSISDISGLPLFRTNADGTVSMGEFGGNVGIGLTNPTYKLQVAGRASIGNTLFVSGNAHFGTEAYHDAYGTYYSPTLTVTDNFAGDTGIQIQNKSSDLNARSGIQIFNDANDYFSMHLGSSDYAGIGQSFAYIDTFRFLDVNAGNGMLFRTGSGVAIRVVGAGVTIVPVTESTSTTTGSLVVNGGAGIAKSLNVGGYLSSKPAYATAGLGADQTLTAGSDNLILFTDNADPNTWWTGVAGVGVSHIFKPNIAGLYFVSCQVNFKTGSGSGQLNIQARKNGSTFSLSQDVLNTVEGRTLNLSGVVELNGSTDYVDFSAYTNSSGTPLLTGEGNRQYSQATIYKIF